MTDMITLKTQKRTVDGKAVRHLRREGIIPGVLYGPTIEAVPLQVEWTVLRPALRAAGGSSLIALSIDDEEHNALVRDVQRDPLRGDVLHIDFYRVRMDVAIRTEVPIVTVGEPEKIIALGGIVAQEMNSIMVECLPGNLPSQIDVDISLLKEVGETVSVSQLPQLEGVVYMANDDDTVISSSYPRAAVEEEEEEVLDESLIEDSAEPELIRAEREDDEE